MVCSSDVCAFLCGKAAFIQHLYSLVLASRQGHFDILTGGVTVIDTNVDLNNQSICGFVDRKLPNLRGFFLLHSFI